MRATWFDQLRMQLGRPVSRALQSGGKIPKYFGQLVNKLPAKQVKTALRLCLSIHSVVPINKARVYADFLQAKRAKATYLLVIEWME